MSVECEKPNVIFLLNAREFGSTINRFKFRKKYSKYHERAHSDFKILRSLYCSSGAYLETIACRKVEASKTPAFFHGRLFTQNFQTWFNLFTGPTSGPLLMSSDVLAEFKNSSGTTGDGKIKIVDAVCIQPAYSCTPPSDGSRRGAQMILLSKGGWLYQVDVLEGKSIDSFFIPSKYSLNNIIAEGGHISTEKGKVSSEFNPIHSYLYATTNEDCESIVIKSSRKVLHGSSTTAFLILHLYPLRVHCHFLVAVATPSSNPPITAEVTSDFLVVTTTKASKISFYSLKDVIDEHKYDSTVKLKERVKMICPIGRRDFMSGEIGDSHIGIPYTMHTVELSSKTCLFQHSECLFKTAALKHNIQFGGVPYHYIVASNRHGTAWALKHLYDDTEATRERFQVSEKWDSTHWNSVRFHEDDTGRIVKQDVASVEVFSITHHHPHYDNNPPSQCSKGSVASCSVIRNFSISVDTEMETRDDNAPQWQYPFSHDIQPLPPHTITTHGRASRKPRPWYGSAYHRSQCVAENDGHILAHVEYEHELNVLGLLYYKPIGPVVTGWEIEECSANLHLSLYDNFDGSCLANFLVDSDISPSDRDAVSITIDQDTVIYIRLRANDHRVQYRVLRLNRQPGSDIIVTDEPT